MSKPAITMPAEHWDVLLDALALAIDSGKLDHYKKTRALTAARRIQHALNTTTPNKQR
jgi:hypothetical protein